MNHELYQAVILDHNKHPRNFCKLTDATHSIEGFNPLCGDHFWIYLKVDSQNTIENISFEGKGCAISLASASMMTESLKGKTVGEAQILFEEFHALVSHKLNPEIEPNHLGKLQLFSGVWKYPARIKCAILSWRSMKEALSGNNSLVKTE